ncbi:MAG: hypothetical protein WKG07_20450 [Hymenobacter sp.]
MPGGAGYENAYWNGAVHDLTATGASTFRPWTLARRVRPRNSATRGVREHRQPDLSSQRVGRA